MIIPTNGINAYAAQAKQAKILSAARQVYQQIEQEVEARAVAASAESESKKAEKD